MDHQAFLGSAVSWITSDPAAPLDVEDTLSVITSSHGDTRLAYVEVDGKLVHKAKAVQVYSWISQRKAQWIVTGESLV